MLDLNSEDAYRQIMIGEAADDPIVARMIESNLDVLQTDSPDVDVTARFASLAEQVLKGYRLYGRDDADAVYVRYMVNLIEAQTHGQA